MSRAARDGARLRLVVSRRSTGESDGDTAERAWRGVPGAARRLLETFEASQRRRGLADSTIARRRSALTAWARWLAPRPVTEATWRDVEAFLDSRGDLAATTTYAWVSHLHRFYVHLVRHGHADDDPTMLVDRPKLPRHLPRPISDTDLARAMDRAGPVMRAWLELGAYAGLRVSEIAALAVRDVTPERIRVRGKGSRDRVVPNHPRIVEALDGLDQVVPEHGPVFVQPTGRPYTAEQVSRLIGVYFDDIGVDANAHQLRHWCGTQLARVAPLRVVQEFLGHSSITSTQIYTDVAADELAAASALLPAA